MAGKTIALNNLNGPTRVAIEAWLEKSGVVPQQVKFVEVPNAAMLQALDERVSTRSC
jgi:ABC-type nitrate/sulfonate/bicarbonate transport system substrate-binding protein